MTRGLPSCLLGIRKTPAGFEEANLFLLADEAGELDVLLQATRRNFRRQRVTHIADEHGAEARELCREVLQRGEQIVDALLSVDPAYPDGVINPLLLW